MAKETKEQPLFYIPKHNTEMDSKAIWFKSGIMHSNWKKTTIWNISFCLFLPRKKNYKHCNSDRFIDNLVWDNQLYTWYCIYNQFEGEGYKVCCNLSYTQTWHIFFLLFFFKTSNIINISKLTESWNYRPGSDISISLNHLATKYLWKTIMNFSNAGGKLKIETG